MNHQLLNLDELKTNLEGMIGKQKEHYEQYNQHLVESCRNFNRLLTQDPKKINLFRQCSVESIKECLKRYIVLDIKNRAGGDNVYLIPYKGICKLSIGYRGLEQLLMRTKSIRWIKSMVITENLTWEMVDNAPVTNSPKKLRPDEFEKHNILGAVAWLRLLDGEYIPAILTKKEIEKARDSSKMPNGDPWTKYYSEMARKTAIRRLMKHTIEGVFFNLDAVLEKQFEVALEEETPNNLEETEIEQDAITTLEDFEEDLEDE